MPTAIRSVGPGLLWARSDKMTVVGMGTERGLMNAGPPTRERPAVAATTKSGGGLLANLRSWAAIFVLLTSVALGYAFMRRRRLQQLRLEHEERDPSSSCAALQDAVAVVQRHGGGMFEKNDDGSQRQHVQGGESASQGAEENDPLFTRLV